MSDNNKKPSGVIWAPDDVHHVYVGGKPTRVFTPQYGMPNIYNAFQRGIRAHNGIPLGIDHLPEEVLKANPVLAETLKASNFNPYDVGRIKGIALDNDRIKITDSEITNPTIQKLYNEGKLPAFSMVGNPITTPCTTGKADIIVDDFSHIHRVDFVMTGGCSECKTNNEFLTAKLSELEENTMTEEIKDEKLKTEEIVEEEVKVEDIVEEEIEEVPEVAPLTLADVKNAVLEIVTPLFEGSEQKVEAKLAEIKESVESETKELQLEARSAKLEVLIDAKIAEGFATPAMKKGLLTAGLAMETSEEVDEMLGELKTKMWDGNQLSNLEAKKPEDKQKELDDAKARLGMK
jgi:hypothetical protein